MKPQNLYRIGALALLIPVALTSRAKPQDPAPFRLSVNVDFVVMQASVHDRKGIVVSGLSKQDFEIHEDGVKQEIRLFQREDVPVTVGLVVDHSGSMRHKISDVITAASTFVKSSNPEDQMFVVNFNENVTLGLPPTIQYSNNPEVLAAAISQSPATGKTALYDAIMLARKQLEGGTQNRKVLIIISDGGDNASKYKLSQVLKIAEQSNTLIYTIGIFDENDPDKNIDVLKRLALATGGEAYFPGEYKQVVAICESIARDIRSRYTLGYVSTNATHPGTYRKVRVVAVGAGKAKLSVRTRSGYTSAAEPKSSVQ